MSDSEDEAPETRLARARFVEQQARGRWYATLNEVQRRTTTAGLASRALDEVKEAGGVLAQRTADAARRRPVATAIIAAGVLAFVLRRPLGRGVRKLVSRRRATSAPDE